MLHFVLHDSFNPSTNNPLYLNNLHRFTHSLYLYISFYRPYNRTEARHAGDKNEIKHKVRQQYVIITAFFINFVRWIWIQQ